MAQAVLGLDSIKDHIDPIEERPSLVTGSPGFHGVTEAVCNPVEWTPPLGWYIALGISMAMLGVFGLSIGYLLLTGVGIWGNNIPVAWGWPIINFVFWVGIGHAGTLISAVLFLFRQQWRTSINRAAEAMTIFAVICALVFPGIHTGRPWLDYWMVPLPNEMLIYPQFRSPLMWDVFAVSVYFTVSLIFWYLGLVPDLATIRDRAKGKIRQFVYGFLSLGWRGSQRHWHHYERAYLLLAGLATPLVLSVHSVVSFDFAVAQLPGWHTTIFPPYFVAGAIFSGMAMVITLMVICRVVFKLEHIITMLHFDRMAKLILVTGTMVGFGYSVEFFIAWYSGNPFEQFTFINRAFGPYAWAYWIMISCNLLSPQIFWWTRARRSIPVLFVVSILVNIGMWFERFVIVVTSLHRDFLPSSWDYFSPTMWDISTLLGSFGLFFTLFVLFVRYAPMVAMAELKGVMPEAHVHAEVGEAYRDEVEAAVAAQSAQPDGDTEEEGEVYGVLAEFEKPDELLAASHLVKDANYTKWDTHSPFPVHGLERAMGLKRSPVPWFVLIMGLAGAAFGMALQWWVSVEAYPLVISGKPLFSWPAFVPIMFECGVLGGALGAVIGFLLLSKLPEHFHPLFRSKTFEKVTDDRFFISIDRADPRFDEAQTIQLLRAAGASRVELVRA
jgi:molybdopterin-containing oxidoreductase family membrane subunit